MKAASPRLPTCLYALPFCQCVVCLSFCVLCLGAWLKGGVLDHTLPTAAWLDALTFLTLQNQSRQVHGCHLLSVGIR